MVTRQLEMDEEEGKWCNTSEPRLFSHVLRWHAEPSHPECTRPTLYCDTIGEAMGQLDSSHPVVSEVYLHSARISFGREGLILFSRPIFLFPADNIGVL